METSWIVNLRMAFDGSAQLAGQGSIPSIPSGGPILLSGGPMGKQGLLIVDRFIEAAAARGVQRLYLMCADGITENLELGWGRYSGDEFVLVGEPAGVWQLRHSRERRFVFLAAELPTTRQLDIAEAASRLKGLLEACLAHPVPSYRRSVRRGLEILDGRSLPPPAYVQSFGISEAATRLYAAAMQITGVKLTGMGGFDDMTLVSHFDVVYTVAQAVAASTRD